MSQDFIKRAQIEDRLTNEKTPFVTSQGVNVIIPICCREGWPSCIHIAQKQRKIKTNIGL